MHERRSFHEKGPLYQTPRCGYEQRTSVLRGRGEVIPPFSSMPILRIVLISSLCGLLPVHVALAGSAGIEGVALYRGSGLPGAYVEVFDGPPDGAVTPVASTNTGSEGRYAVSLPAGDYFITVKKRPSGAGSGGMLFGTSGSVLLTVRSSVVSVPPILIRDRGGSGTSGDGAAEVTGRVTFQEEGAPGSYVYVYPGGLRRGPGYAARARTREDGSFSVRVDPGTYTVTVRRTEGGEGMGTVRSGDLVGEYAGNPLAVGADGLDVGAIGLRRVDPDTLRDRRWAAEEGGLTVTGLISDEEGRPTAGLFAFLYSDRRMVGKPDAISAPTGDDGMYRISVDEPGTYYLGARSRYGGPVEPGELMGAYEAAGIKPVVLARDRPGPRLDIVVREVW